MKYQDENNLAESLRRGEEDAFDHLFRLWYQPLCRYACRLADGDMDEAEDLVQQSFAKLWEQRSRIDVSWSLKAYLYKAVHNACLNRVRAQKVRSRYLDFTAQQMDAMHTPPEDTSPELMERFRQAMEALPPQCRHIFELSRFESLKYREIAEQLGISIKTVETQMGKALRTMRTQLADYLITFFGTLCLWQSLSPAFDLSPILKPFLHGSF